MTSISLDIQWIERYISSLQQSTMPCDLPPFILYSTSLLAAPGSAWFHFKFHYFTLAVWYHMQSGSAVPHAGSAIIHAVWYSKRWKLEEFSTANNDNEIMRLPIL